MGPKITEPAPDPTCYRPDCDAANHCDDHDLPVHHAVDSLGHGGCRKRVGDGKA